MKTSQKGICLIKSMEGYASKPYWDYKGYSGGYGHLGIAKDTVITKELAEEWLKSDLQKFESNVNKFNAVYHFNQNQFDALVSFAYNIGSINQLCADGKRSIAEISAHITDYVKAGGKINNGLVKRRTAEKALFDAPIESAAFPKWVNVGNDYYLRLADGQNAHGWHDVAETSDKSKKHRYYFDANGRMLTGAKYVDNKLYYFKESGGLMGALCKTSADNSLEPIYL